MPFSEDFDDIYRLGIKDACAEAGAYCERVDEQTFHERILDRIYNQIAKADIIIADMTGRNANVFYEVGYAHALGKLTILLTQNVNDIPFDLKHFPHIVYETKISYLREELEKRVKYFIENPPTKTSDTKLGLELYIEDQDLTSGKAIVRYPAKAYPDITITIYNAEGDTLAPGDFKIGLLTNSTVTRFRDESVMTTELPKNKGGGYLHMLPDFPALFPNSYVSYQMLPFDGQDSEPKEYQTVVRLFTKQGNWDFPLTLRGEV